MEENSRKSIKIAKNAHFSFNKNTQNVGVSTRKNRINSLNNNILQDKTKQDYPSGYQNINSNKQHFNEKSLNENNKVVADYNNFLKTISQMHLSGSVYCDWNYINTIEAPYDLPNGEIGPKEAKSRAELEKFNNFVIFKLLSPITKKYKEMLENQIATSSEYDKTDYKKWEKLHNLSVGVLDGNIDAYIQVIEDFKPFDDITELGSFFIINFENSDVIEIEFRVSEDNLMPESSYSLGENGQLLEKPYTKTEFYSIIDSFISSTSIRVARDMFDILPVNTVYVQVIKNVPNKFVDISEVSTVASIKFTRDAIESMDIYSADPTTLLQSFPHNRNYVQGEGFSAVQQLSR